MDAAMFEEHLGRCHFVPELARGLEIFIFTDPQENKIREETLLNTDFKDFLHQTVVTLLGKFKQPSCPEGVTRTSTLRFILQKEVDLANTFEPTNMSLPLSVYKMMVETMHLPFQWIETSSCVGPFFWSTLTELEGTPRFQLVYRKSDVKKEEKTRGWELVLSHDIHSSTTTGFYKGTKSSKISECVKIIRKCVLEIGHPMFLPILICARDINMEGDLRHRETRETVRVLEKDITEAAEIYTHPDVTRKEVFDLGLINKKLIECHCRVLWKRPEAYLDIVSTMQDALKDLHQHWPDARKRGISSQHSTLEARLRFLRVKLQGISTYRKVTIARLEMLQGLVENLVSLSIARSQKRIMLKGIIRAHTHGLEEIKEKDIKERRQKEKELQDELDNKKQVSIALVGVLFLPGAFLAAIFSTTFFNFQAEDPGAIISPWFWVYWVITVPATLIVFGLWGIWHVHVTNIKVKKNQEIKEMMEEEERKVREVRMQPLEAVLSDL